MLGVCSFHVGKKLQKHGAACHLVSSTAANGCLTDGLGLWPPGDHHSDPFSHSGIHEFCMLNTPSEIPGGKPIIASLFSNSK